MILVIGTENCPRCMMVKNILTNKNIEFDYKMFSFLSSEEQEKYLNMAEKTGQMSFPLIIRDGKIIEIMEV